VLNVLVTDKIGDGDARSFMSGKTAVSMIGANSTDKSDLSIEMAHQFMGDTRGAMAWAASKISDPAAQGMLLLIPNMITNIGNDSERAWMNHLDQRSGPMSYYPLASAFHHNAEVFQRYVTPTTKPQ
jgi:hypothetical protein